MTFDETFTGVEQEESFMFDFLKKKISGFIDGITKKEEEKAEPPQAKPPEKEEELVLEIPEPEAISGPEEKPARRGGESAPEKRARGERARSEAGTEESQAGAEKRAGPRSEERAGKAAGESPGKNRRETHP